jgi:hypothetical protein
MYTNNKSRFTAPLKTDPKCNPTKQSKLSSTQKRLTQPFSIRFTAANFLQILFLQLTLSLGKAMLFKRKGLKVPVDAAVSRKIDDGNSMPENQRHALRDCTTLHSLPKREQS